MVPSEMGSRDRENVEFDELREGNGATRDPSSTFGFSPSIMDCLRAWGWCTGTVVDRASGDEIRG